MNKLIPRGFSMLKIKKLVIGTVLSVSGTAVILSLLSGVMVKTGMFSGQLAGTLTVAGCGAVLLVCALLTARLAGERGLLHGTLLAIVYSAAYAAGAYLLCGCVPAAQLLTGIAVFLLCGMIGGVIGVSLKRKIRF